MPRAEAGSSKALANKMKSKGLQRLRWYCQVCEKQCRDENGFKCHTQSESHVRNMQLVGENSGRVISDYSRQFQNDFIHLLKTAHVDKAVHINQFYQEYIHDKEHIHMNSTRWNSLTEFGKYLGREGICRVTETEKGMFIAWIDNSPDALARREAVKRREALDRGDEQRDRKELEAQVKRAQQAMQEREKEQEANSRSDEERTEQIPKDGQKIAFSLKVSKSKEDNEKVDSASPEATDASPDSETSKKPFKLSIGRFGTNKSKPQKVFKQQKKAKDKDTEEAPKKMSAMERIMRDEIERKRRREDNEHGMTSKKLRTGE